MKIRDYNSDDCKVVADLFYQTVHAVCVNDYTEEQLEVWAPTPIDYKKWQERLDRKKPFLAIVNNAIVGFIELEEGGYIDCFYVDKNFQRKGVGSFLLDYAEELARSRNYDKMYAEVSITAKPFFLKHGFRIIKENVVRVGNQELKNFIMEKTSNFFRGAQSSEFS